MDNSKIHIQELSKVIVKDFQVENKDFPASATMDDVKKKLAAIIRYLIDKDINRLLTIFYRIDLEEEKVKQILAISPVGEISSRLAELVIQREMEKVKTRLKYRS